MNQDIENIIEKEFDLKYPDYGSDILSKAKTATEIAIAENEIFRRNKLKKFVYNIADEVLKVVVENERQRIGQEIDLIWRDTHHDLNLFEQAICELQEDLLFNSSTLEGERSEHLSLNKENK